MMLTCFIDPWPEFEAAMGRLVSPDSSVAKQRLFFTLVSEYPAVVADMDITSLLDCFRTGLGAVDRSTALVTDAVKASIATLKSDDRFQQLEGIVPEILQVRL